MTVGLEKEVDLSGKPVDPLQASELLLALTIRRIDVPDATAHRLSGLLHPGATMVITDHPDDPALRTEPGFTIIAADTT
jgi:hypothetical protein